MVHFDRWVLVLEFIVLQIGAPADSLCNDWVGNRHLSDEVCRIDFKEVNDIEVMIEEC